MATPATINAMDLLKQIQGVDENSVMKAAEKQALVISKDVMPDDPDLIEPYEAGYVTGVELKTPNGRVLTPKLLAAIFMNGTNISLVGPAGSGKTALAFHIIDIINADTRKENLRIHAENVTRKRDGKALLPYMPLKYPRWHVACHEATRSEDLTVASKVSVSNGIAESAEILGAFISAYMYGGILAIEEWDHSMAGVLVECHAMLDGHSKSVQFYVNGMKKYVRHNNFLGCIATSNSKGMGEANRNYAGTQMQNRAFRSRLGCTVEVSYLPASVETKVLTNLGLPTIMAEKMVSVGNRIRQASQVSREFDMEFSLRDLINWARITKEFCDDMGIKVSASNAWVQAIAASYPAFLSREDALTQSGVFKYVNIS
jgi:hypothetical protein